MPPRGSSAGRGQQPPHGCHPTAVIPSGSTSSRVTPPPQAQTSPAARSGRDPGETPRPRGAGSRGAGGGQGPPRGRGGQTAAGDARRGPGGPGGAAGRGWLRPGAAVAGGESSPISAGAEPGPSPAALLRAPGTGSATDRRPLRPLRPLRPQLRPPRLPQPQQRQQCRARRRPRWPWVGAGLAGGGRDGTPGPPMSRAPHRLRAPAASPPGGVGGQELRSPELSQHPAPASLNGAGLICEGGVGESALEGSGGESAASCSVNPPEISGFGPRRSSSLRPLLGCGNDRASAPAGGPAWAAAAALALLRCPGRTSPPAPSRY